MKNKAVCLSRALRRATCRMLPRLWATAACVLLTAHAHAVTCINNLPPSNPDAAYTVHGNGTATDARTGLMWKVCVEGQTWSAGACIDVPLTFTWANALAHAEGHAFAIRTDWRLPNLKELRSLVEDCRVNPAVNDAIFPSTPSFFVWSGSPYAYSSSDAWYVNFGSGAAGNFGNRSDTYLVRLVRGGQ